MKDQIKMFNRQPSVVSYKSIDDLKVLKDWFYNFNDARDLRYRAIEKVKAISSRGKLPHCIESTSFLTSICLTDPEFTTMGNSSNESRASRLTDDANVLQLSYSMALIRFVNGLLDSLQQSNFAIPLYQLAKSMNVPSFFVELRHMATHEKLPSLAMLRIGVKNALNWLYDNYWSKIENIDSDDEDESKPMDDTLLQKDIDLIQSKLERFEMVEDVLVGNLKIYKKIRKQNIDYIYKFGNSTENGTKYWKSIRAIKKICEKYGNDGLIKVLIYKDFLIKLKDYNEKYCILLHKLYAPLLEEFGLPFNGELLHELVYQFEPKSLVDEKLYKKLNLAMNHQQRHQAIFWIGQLMTNITTLQRKQQKLNLPLPGADIIPTIVMRLDKLALDDKLLIFDKLQSFQLPPEVMSHISTTLPTLQNRKKLQQYEEVLSLDAILSDSSSEPPQKKPKPEKRPFLFDVHDTWEPTPFGTII